MFSSRSCPRSCAPIAVFFLVCGCAHGAVIFTDVMFTTAGDATQLGRLSRSGVPSDWSAPKPFPGVINTTTSYHYTTLDLDLPALSAPFNDEVFIQIDFDSIATTTFLSAYLNSYDPHNPAATYLGDPGSSGHFSGVDPLTFQFFVPYGNHIVLVLNETTSNAGLNLPGIVTVEAFADTAYTDRSATPEPGTWVLLAGGMAFLALRRRPRLLARHGGTRAGWWR